MDGKLIGLLIGFAIGSVRGWVIGRLLVRPGLWLIDRVKWWRLATGRTTAYSGGDWAFTRREFDLQRMIDGWKVHCPPVTEHTDG